MAIRDPWHFKKENVHHTNTECLSGSKLQRPFVGTGGKPLCSHCAQLNSLEENLIQPSIQNDKTESTSIGNKNKVLS